MSEKGTLHVVVREIARALAPLHEATRDLPRFRALLRRLGWRVTSLPPAYATLGEAALDAAAAVESLADDPTLAEVLEAVDRVGAVYRAARALSVAPGGVDAGAFLADVGEALFEFLLLEYLASARPALYRLLEMLDVVVHEHTPATATRPAVVRSRLLYDQIPQVLADPLSVPGRVYGWGTADFDFALLSEHLLYVFSALGLNASRGGVDDALGDALQAGPRGEIAKTIDTRVAIPLVEVEVAGRLLEAGLEILELPAEGTLPPGFLVRPDVPDGIAERVRVGPATTFLLRAGTDLASQFALVLRPGEISLRYPFAGPTLPSAGFGVALEHAPETPTVLLGTPGKSRLEVAGAEFALNLDVRGGQLELKLDATPRGLALVVSPADLDGFLGSLAGGSPLVSPVTFAASWSNRTGFSFVGGVGIALSTYPHLRLGPLTLDRIDLALGGELGPGGPPSLRASAAVTLLAAVGPIGVAVDGIGVALRFVFEDGNAGPFDVRAEFVPPTGLGLTVDAGPVAGGGFVRFEPENRRYSGVLHLEVFGIAVTAIGLLTTRDGDGRDLPPPGFSFLILVSARFPPIQLGYGFTLNGVGGLAGLHRTMVVDALQSGLRDGSVDHVLFSEDPAENAPRIVADLQRIFPPSAGRHVFGPMALIGWGTPTLIYIELGVVVELPSPVRLVLLGQVRVDLPTEDAPIVALRIDVLGVLEFEKKRLSIDATLRDSSVAGFPVTGDMALRLTWGASPSFALAIGGLNPHFQPPPGFPTLERVTIALGMEGNPRLSLQAYMAVTSNSVQFGARGELYASAGGFNITGWAGFDALVVFVPFSFRADISAGFALRRGSKRIAGIRVEATLTGPSPYHVWGEGCLSLLFFDICVDFDATFGERRTVELPARDPWEELRTALEDPRNWSGALPAGVVPAVDAAPLPDDAAGVVLIHPCGTAVVRQHVLPLDKALERFGELELAGPKRYQVASVTVGDVTLGEVPESAWTVVYDLLPPALSENLSESDKLSRPSFEEEVVGVEVGAPEAAYGAAKALDVEYESRIVDSTWETRRQPRFPLPRDLQLRLVQAGAKAYSPLHRTGPRKFSPPAGTPPAVALDPEAFVIATTDALASRPDLGRHRTRGAALEALGAHLGAGAAGRGRLQVVPASETDDGA